MIKLNRVVALALGLILTLSVMPTLARAELGKGYPGETAKVQIVVEDVISLDGEVSISAGSEFVESIDCAVVERGGLKGGMVTGNKVFLYSTAANPTPGDVTIEVTVNLKENAEVNEQCIVSLNYVGSTDAAGMTVNDPVTKSASVAIKEKPATTPTTEPEESTKPTTKPNTNTNTNTRPNTNTNTNTKPNTNTNTNNNSNNNQTNPTNPTTATKPKANYDELKKQISIAKGLRKDDYEAAAWDAFVKVLEEAEKLTSSEDQDKVDDAADKLEEAIAKLVGVDHTKLREALDSVAEYSQNLELSSLWYQMISVLENAEDKLHSSDQAAVDAAAAQVESLLEEIAKAEKEVGSGTIIQEVPVEVLPSDDYCNITIHNIWPILFFISLALNVAMAAVIIIYVLRVQKSRKDDTPLVDYDIDDDLFMDDIYYGDEYMNDMDQYMDDIDLRDVDMDDAEQVDVRMDNIDPQDLEEEIDFDSLDFDDLDLDSLDLDSLDLDWLDLDSLDLEEEEFFDDLDLDELDLEALGFDMDTSVIQ